MCEYGSRLSIGCSLPYLDVQMRKEEGGGSQGFIADAD